MHILPRRGWPASPGRGRVGDGHRAPVPRAATSRPGAAALAVLVTASLAAGCGPDIDVAQVLEVRNAITGYTDLGIVDGKNKLVPSISFQVRNTGEQSVTNVQLNAVFRVIGDQEELGSALVRGIGADGLAPGQESEPFVMRSALGYTGEQSRAQMLQHTEFRDVQVEVFAKHGSRQWVKLTTFKVDRQLLTR
jgi:hypothetical protein